MGTPQSCQQTQQQSQQEILLMCHSLDSLLNGKAINSSGGHKNNNFVHLIDLKKERESSKLSGFYRLNAIQDLQKLGG